MRDIPAATIRALARKGIRVLSFMALPTGRGYVVNHKGTCRVLTHADLLALAKREAR